ncbi:proteophosphoglycan ppg4 [Rhodotorula toruloides]|uniref:Proteophosphoglycan ppg4 n=1 Tax=Rhodotorula toruloides TaxID=5286 RepID=A0A511KJQ4_RHOTO|nr:proteophosphoglycan ppg4 [Rhodotorula toruloides]
MKEIESSSESEQDEEDGATEQEEEDEAEEEKEVAEEVKPRRAASRRTKNQFSPQQESDNELAPAIKPSTSTPTRASTSARKSPSKQPPALIAQASKRMRGSSNFDLRNVDEMDAAEVKRRLEKEKSELMARLSQHGIVPHADVLDRALRSMSSANEKLTVDGFLRSLSSLDANVSPIASQQRPLQAPALSVSVQAANSPANGRKVSFNTLESPSTPSSADRPAFLFPSPSQQGLVTLLPPSQPGSLASPAAASNGDMALKPAHPAAARAARLSAFANRSHSAPNIPTLNTMLSAPPNGLPIPPPLPSPSFASGLVATSVAGMGRVALSRRSMFGSIAPDAIQQSLSSPVEAVPTQGLLPAFSNSSSSALRQSGSSSIKPLTSTSKIPSDASRLLKLQSWLDDDGETTDDEDDKRPGAAVAAEATLKAVAAKSVIASVPPPKGMQMVDVPASDDEEGGPRMHIGGKSVQVLRQSHKRQLGDHVGASSMSTRMSTRSAVKGKAKAVAECVCGKQTEGDPSAVQCAECDVAFHLSCLNVASARQLASPWVCNRCAIVGQSVAHDEADNVQTTPRMATKRVRIGTNSTPHVLSEPTFVASTPLSAPRSNNFSFAMDIALAPSPTASPVRRFTSAVAPTSPPPNEHLVIPVTPQFGEATIRAPGDYSPTSPQNSRVRANRTRMISNGAGGLLGSEWLHGWDGHAYEQGAHPAPAPSNALNGFVDEDWPLPAWSDVTMTPSRALTNSTPATSTSSSARDTPFAHSSAHLSSHSRRSSLTFGHPAASTGHFRTPSQDFLAALDRDHHSPSAHHTFAQRLFGSAGPAADSHHYAHDPAAAPFSSPTTRPISPLNPRRQLQHGYVQHRRQPSFGDGLGRPFFPPHSPPAAHSFVPGLAHERIALSASMKVSHSAPGGRVAPGGLIVSPGLYGGDGFDDLLL